MTNPSTQHEAAIQEGERIAAADEYFAARTWIMDNPVNRRIFEAGFDRAYALLSKLRAPVAGEAQKPVAWLIDWPEDPELGHYLAESPAETGRCLPLVFADAVTQTSEPVYAYRRKGLDDFVTCDRERFDELSAKPRLFETRIFYAAPQASEAVRKLPRDDGSDSWDGARRRVPKTSDAVRDAARWRSFRNAVTQQDVGWLDRMDAALTAMGFDLDDEAPPSADQVDAAADTASAALSAQPGAQKGKNDA